MDAETFDTLARSLRTNRSRRSTLVPLLGGALGLLTLAETDAKKKGKKHKKKHKTGGDQTADPSPPPFVCPPQRVCGPGCCPEGQVCGSTGACVDPSCCSGDATCGPHTSVGRLCCIAPRVARCCCDTTPGAGNGYVHCCMGAECDVSCPGGNGDGTGGMTVGCGARGGNATLNCPG
jgi:hypothetical protein